jgi:pimeloyl-ACP methyl ester carboxylesterase
MTRQPPVVFIRSGSCDYGRAVIEYTRMLVPVFVAHVGHPEFVRCDLSVEPLRQALSSSDIRGPYVLAGHSFGGLTALSYRQQWPGEVAGLLLIDSTHPDQTQTALALLPPPGLLSSEPIEEFRSFISGFGPVYESSCEYARSIRSVGDTPLIVLAAGRPKMPAGITTPLREELTAGWHGLQAGYARLSSRGQLRIIPNAGHDLMDDEPGECIQAIKDLLLICQDTLTGRRANNRS